MEKWQWITIAWLAFDVIVFVWAWLDKFYYEHNVSDKWKKIRKTMTEE